MKKSRAVEPYLTIAEIVRDAQPDLFHALVFLAAEGEVAGREVFSDCCEAVHKRLTLTAAHLENRLKYYAKIMEEPPRPGRGG